MGRKGAQHAGRSVQVRTVAAFVFLLLFGLQIAPLAQAQATQTPDCCMAAEGKGCSMHLHRAMQGQGTANTVAAVQPQCPCMPLAPASVVAHGASDLRASRLFFGLAAQRAERVQALSLRHSYETGCGGTRGPPAVMHAA